MNASKMDTLNAMYKLSVAEAERDIGSAAVTETLHQFKALCDRARYAKIDGSEMEGFLDRVYTDSPKMAYCLAFSTQVGLALIQDALENDGGVSLYNLKGEFSKYKDVPLDFGAQHVLFARSVKTLGADATDLIKSLSKQFNENVPKGPNLKSAKAVLKTYKKAFSV